MAAAIPSDEQSFNDLAEFLEDNTPQSAASSQPMDSNNSIDLTVIPNEHSKSKEDPSLNLDKSTLLQKPISHSPKISPSSIPNPSPSITETKQTEPFSNYSNYLYTIPGYSAFQPVGYPGYIPPVIGPQNTTSINHVPSPSHQNKETNKAQCVNKDIETIDLSEDRKLLEVKDKEPSKSVESKMSITSLIQGSGATVTMPSSPTPDPKKQTERFSLITSIPISKIDMKSMNPPDTNFLNANKRISSSSKSAFQPVKPNESVNTDAQSNLLQTNLNNDVDVANSKTNTPVTNSINALISAAEVINSESKNRKRDRKDNINEIPTKSQTFPSDNKSLAQKPEGINYEPKNKILLIQNKNTSSKMLVISPQQNNTQVLLPRTNYDQKNLQAPSRPSTVNRKYKDYDNGTTSKVVALKRTHQADCDENDFENLITENQIYGNKIVVKEKLNNNKELQKQNTTDKSNQMSDNKNVMLQSNFVYLSNVKFPANLMMIKNNKVNNIQELNKHKYTDTMKEVNQSKVENNLQAKCKNNGLMNKEIHVLKTSNNLLQSISNQNNKGEFVFQSNQKLIMNPQILYQVPMLVDNDDRKNSTTINKDQPSDQKLNEKLFIACPYQMDSKLQPKIVITNIRPKVSSKIEELSTIDVYEKRKRLRRLKYLSNKDMPKVEIKKSQDLRHDIKNAITPDKMVEEVSKEFARTKIDIIGNSSDSDSEYDDRDLIEYNKLINEYKSETNTKHEDHDKKRFLSEFRLADRVDYIEKLMAIEERAIEKDSIASAYITAGRIDKLRVSSIQFLEDTIPKKNTVVLDTYSWDPGTEDTGNGNQKKKIFLSQLQLVAVSKKFKEEFNQTWNIITKERKRRNGRIIKDITPNKISKAFKLDTNDQLQFLTDIKISVHENNNIIKRRFDNTGTLSNDETIHEIARKSFTELSKLSMMADRSVKVISGHDTFDLNTELETTQPFSTPINIPNLSKIVALKSCMENGFATSQAAPSQASSIDEPLNSAAVTRDNHLEKVIKIEEKHSGFYWPGIDAIMESYNQFEIERKKELAELSRRNIQLRVECARTKRATARETELARTLLAERQALAHEERNLAVSINRILEILNCINLY